MRDLPDIRRSGELVLLTESSSLSYYMYRGRPMGFDFELASALAEHLGVKLKVRVIPDLDDMFPMLLRGEGDLIACNLTITPERKQLLSFSHPIDETGAVLVLTKDSRDSLSIYDLSDLHRIPVTVHAYSVFMDVLQQTGLDSLNIRAASGDTDSEALIRMVARGELSATVSDENVARLNSTYYPNLDISLQLSSPMPIGLAMRPNAYLLVDEVNEWLDLPSTQKKIRFLKKKYFDSVREQSERVLSPFSSLGGNQISPWDKTIRKAAEIIGWDWRLLASLIYHESRFNPEAVSYAGAFGLMQLMPETGRKFGIDTTDKTDANILAGARYLRWLDRFWQKHITDSNERIKFVLASYNIGPGHILDAMVIAEHLCLDTSLWESNVEQGLNLKSNRLYYELEGVKNGYCRGWSATDFVVKVLDTFGHFQSYDP